MLSTIQELIINKYNEELERSKLCFFDSSDEEKLFKFALLISILKIKFYEHDHKEEGRFIIYSDVTELINSINNNYLQLHDKFQGNNLITVIEDFIDYVIYFFKNKINFYYDKNEILKLIDKVIITLQRPNYK